MSEIIEGFEVGKRVKVSAAAGFQSDATATIAYPPKSPIFQEDFGDNYFTRQETPDGEKTLIWIIFDALQFDTDGDACSQTAVVTDYLEVI